MADLKDERCPASDYDPLMTKCILDNKGEEYVYDKRRPYKLVEFNSTYHYSKVKKKGIPHVIKNQCEKCSLFSFAFSIFPILRWLPEYKWKSDMYYDIISGITVAILHIPQGLAYSSLGAVPPVVGIYMAYFPVLVYVLMGTSRHISMGTFSVICMMVSKPVLEYATVWDHSTDAGNTSSIVNIANSTGTEYHLTPVQVATAVCLIVGFWQVLFGMLRLGSLSVLMSEFLVSGFTTGAAVLVLTSQVKHIFGLKLPKRTGHLKTIFTYIDLIGNIKSANFLATGLTVGVVVINTIFNDFIKPHVSKKMSVPIPIELLMIIGGSIISVTCDLPNKHGITVVGDIPTGFPPPKLPPLWLLPNLIVDGFLIALVAFSINISMASIFAKKSNYEVDANQELVASGCGNIFGSFFACLPFAASLSRSSIQYTVGGKTQLASVVSCGLLTFVLLFIGPFFEPLPNCVLTGIVIVALRSMFTQVTEFWRAWKQSKRDGFVWMATFLSVVILDIDVALVVGLIISVLCIVLVGQKPTVITLGHIPSTSIYLDLKRYHVAVALPRCLILQIAGAMHFANKDSIRMKVFKRLKQSLKSEQKSKNMKEYTLKEVVPLTEIHQEINNFKHENHKIHVEDNCVKNVILDLSTVFYIDPASVKTLLSIHHDLKSREIDLSLVGCSGKIYEVLRRCDFFKTFPDAQIYPTVHDAVLLTQHLPK